MKLKELRAAREAANELLEVELALAALPTLGAVRKLGEGDPMTMTIGIHAPDSVLSAPVPAEEYAAYLNAMRECLELRRDKLLNVLADLGVTTDSGEIQDLLAEAKREAAEADPFHWVNHIQGQA